MLLSQGLVRVGSEPTSVPESIITALKRRVKEILDVGDIAFIELAKGDHVVINHGPFDGYRAIFDVRIPGTE